LGTEPPPGAHVAGYRVERLLGRGGLGSVVLARDPAGAVVALKLIDLGGGAAADMARAFAREVNLHRRLRHPGIVAVLDAGQVGELAYIAMEYVAGGDLGHLGRARQPWPVRRAAEITGRVAHALAHAHALGIVHHDVKPANILLDEAADLIKLVDFGLARLADLQRSRTGVLAGTPAYMSPEQLAEGAQDARADLYSLGVVLFELLTGQLPYEATSLGALLRQVSQLPAPAVRTLRLEVPPALSDLVARLLAKRPAHRPAGAQVVAEALDAMLPDLPAGVAAGAPPGRGA
jgi:eukaryotic-like serine/threonine-protein kinase